MQSNYSWRVFCAPIASCRVGAGVLDVTVTPDICPRVLIRCCAAFRIGFLCDFGMLKTVVVDLQVIAHDCVAMAGR
jgi:hypothetical protein